MDAPGVGGALHLARRPTGSRLGTLALAAGVLIAAACSTSPTGRSQLKLLPADQVAQMGEQAYAQLQQKEPVAPDSAATRYIQCVARAVTAVVPPPQGGGQWDVTVFQGDQVNAFALPGGNVGIYEGLLQAARSPAQLAAVIGHEIAHVQAEHANARLSTQYAADAGLSIVQAIAAGQGSVLGSQEAMALLGLGAQVGVLLPFNRAQEREADVLGLETMARAGFDPQAAVQLWRNMAEVGGGGGPAFLSTHPSGEDRIRALQDAMPRAMEIYRQAQGRRPDCRSP